MAQVWGKIDRELAATAARYPRPVAGRVRCLGPDDIPEHWWFSPDKKGRRVCPKCEALLDRVPPMCRTVHVAR